MMNNTLNMKKLSLSAILMALFLSCAKPEFHEVEHVFYIGLDGWGSYSVEQSDMQNVKKMMAEWGPSSTGSGSAAPRSRTWSLP